MSTSSIGVSLILVDVQNDFLPSGALAVPSSSKILPPILSLLSKDHKYWSTIVATQDYHPSNHISFADNHEGATPFTTIEVDHPLLGNGARQEKIGQMMWPRHCVQGTAGCGIEAGIKRRLSELRSAGEDVVIIRKGDDPKVDGYSGLSDNAYSRFTAMIRYISSDHSAAGRRRPSTDIAVVVGLATDYCVVSTALDLLKYSISVYIPLDCVAGVSTYTTASAITNLRSAGAHIFDTHQEVMTAVEEEVKRHDSRQGSWISRFIHDQEVIWSKEDEPDSSIAHNEL